MNTNRTFMVPADPGEPGLKAIKRVCFSSLVVGTNASNWLESLISEMNYYVFMRT